MTVRARRAQAYAYTAVTTVIVLVLALAEWAAERFVAAHSRAASLTIEIAIALAAALVFRPIHQRIEAALEAAFTRRKRHALAALTAFRRELSSFKDAAQLMRRVIEAVEHHLEARAAAVYLRREGFRAQASSFETAADDVAADDPLAIRLRSSGAAARPGMLKSAAPGTHAFPMTVAGDLVGFLSVDSRTGEYDGDEAHMLLGLAQDLAVALVALDPLLRARESAASNIPAGLSSLIGRERETGEIEAALSRSRLVTVTGPGGVGKTRIALECAVRELARHEHGAWFVDLAPISDGDLIAPTMLAALDAEARDDSAAQGRLVEHLRPRDALIVVDNCEHVVAAAAALIARIRANCPRITILATSRELLHLDGEQVYRLSSLRPESSAELFAQRAAAVLPGFNAAGSPEAVRSICERLDGIPLAIELAAARVRALGVDEINERLNERFRLLTTGARDAMPRHQTLSATIRWSYELLSGEEQSLLRRLSIFRGSFSLPAAAAVCAQAGKCDEFHVLDVLTSLSDKSLLTVTVALMTRYRMLETIREFALARANEQNDAGEAAQQHAFYFAAVAAQAYHEFDTQMPRGWLEKLAPDIDNFRAALEFTLEGPGQRRTGAQLAADCAAIFLRMDQFGEGLRWCAVARGVSGVPAATAGRIDYGASMMHNNAGEKRPALECAERAVASYEESNDERGLVRALSQVAQLYARAHRYEDAVGPSMEAVKRARNLGDPRVLTVVLRRCASALPASQIGSARTYFEEALSLARDSHDNDETLRILEWWANREAAAGSFERAISLSAQALTDAARENRLPLETQIAGWNLVLRNFDEAAGHAGQALDLALEVRHPLRALCIAYCVPRVAERAPREAAMLFGYAAARIAELEWQPDQDDCLALESVSARIMEMLSDVDDFQALRAAGARLSETEALAVLRGESAGGREPGPAPLDARRSVGTLLI